MAKEKIKLIQIKQALNDARFRTTLPQEITKDVTGYLNNPSCTCNINLYRRLVKDYKKQLQDYYPSLDIQDDQEDVEQLAKNKWQVINCDIKDLETELRKLGPGRKQLEMARYQDQVTVVINDLDLIY